MNTSGVGGGHLYIGPSSFWPFWAILAQTMKNTKSVFVNEILIPNIKNSTYEHLWVVTIWKNKKNAFNVHCISDFGHNSLKMEQNGPKS